MARPLKGSIRERNGAWYASLPAFRGSAERVEHAFDSEEDAQRWLNAAIAAFADNGPIPSPATFQVARNRSTVVSMAPAFAEVARRWRGMAYEDLRKGQLERARRIDDIIRLHLVPWFGPRTSTIQDLNSGGHQLTLDFVLHLAGRHSTSKSIAEIRGAVASEFSIVDAAKFLKKSPQTIRRHHLDGRFRNSRRDSVGKIWIPASDLLAPHLRRDSKQNGGLAKSYATDILWTLRQIVAFAITQGWLERDPTVGITAVEPDAAVGLSRSYENRAKPWTLQECRALATHLHPVHQLAFWMQRILGMRIGEAYGPLVEDVLDLGGFGVLIAERQGGRNFLLRDERGKQLVSQQKARMKTEASSRVIPLPKSMLELVKAVVDVFHTDPDTGEINLSARSIPGLERADESGQAGFRAALNRALQLEGMSSEAVGTRMSPHQLRKSLTTDLAWNADLSELAKRRFVGHVAGDDVFARVYTLDNPDLLELQKVAAHLQSEIESQLDGKLMIPTVRKIRFGKLHSLAARAKELEFALSEAGWSVDAGDGGDPWCTSARVAEELDIETKVARRMMQSGHLPSVVIRDEAGVPRRHVRLSVVMQERDRVKAVTKLPLVAERLGVSYHQLYQMVRHLESKFEKDPRTGEYVLAADDVECLEAEIERVAKLHERSMRISEAGKVLHRAHSTINLMINRGELVLDGETDSSGAKFVTRASVEGCR